MRSGLIVTGLAASLLVGASTRAEPPKEPEPTPFAAVVDLVRFLVGNGKLVQVSAHGKTKAVIEKQDPIYDLPMFPVRALLLKLPPYRMPYTMTVTTYLGGQGRTKHILIPSAGDLFDAELHPTRTIPATAFLSKDAGLMNRSRVEATIPFDDAQRTETLLLLYVNTRTARSAVPIVWTGPAGIEDIVPRLLIRAERSDNGKVELEVNLKK